ncbi:MAG: hypothetical protein WBG11_05330 [Methylocella sp.]
MKRLLLVAASTFITPVHAGGCDEETIRDVARGSSVAVLESGAVYEAEPDNTPDGLLCNAGDSVLVRGDEVHVTRMR